MPVRDPGSAPAAEALAVSEGECGAIERSSHGLRRRAGTGRDQDERVAMTRLCHRIHFLDEVEHARGYRQVNRMANQATIWITSVAIHRDVSTA